MRSGIVRFAQDAEKSTQISNLITDNGISKDLVKSFTTEYLSILSNLFPLHLPGCL